MEGRWWWCGGGAVLATFLFGAAGWMAISIADFFPPNRRVHFLLPIISSRQIEEHPLDTGFTLRRLTEQRQTDEWNNF